MILDEKEQIPYETLILASGGIPRRLPVEGASLENVFTLRSIQDTQKIDAGQLSSSIGSMHYPLSRVLM